LKRGLNIAFWAIFFMGFFILWGFTLAEQGSIRCAQLVVKIEVDEGMTFISQEDVETMLKQANIHPVGKVMEDISIEEMEYRLDQIAEIKKSEVYKTIDGNVYIKVRQRKPIVRILNANGSSFYLDEEGLQMPLSDNYTARVPLVSGYINESITKLSAVEIGKSDLLKNEMKSDDVFVLATFLKKDKFWNAQIQQIYYNQQGDIELIPSVGEHRIIFGDLDHMEGKFNKLMIFYKDGLNKTNWNIYNTINLKFKNQIICTKK
jgi:cell division protein FtsQ